MAPTTAPAPPPPAPAPPPAGVGARPLRRSVDDRHLGGVAGGLARYLGVDTYVLRAALLVLGIFSLGFVVLAYAAAWVLVPDDLEEEPIAARWYREHGPARERPVATVLLLIAAAVALSGFWAVLGGWNAAGPFPTLLTLTVLLLILATRQGPPSTTGATLSSPTDPGSGTGTGTGTGTDTGTDTGSQDPTVVDPTEPTTAIAADEPTTAVAPVVEGDGSAARARRSTERRRHRLIRNVALLGALEAGAVTGALWWSEVGGVPGWVVPTTMLGVLLVALALTPWWGWSWTVATFAALLLPFVLLSTVAGVTLRGGIGHRVERPVAVADLPDRYRLGIGHQQLDLTQLDLAPGSRTVVGVETGIGHTEVTVPAEAELVVRTRVGGGEVTVDGEVAVDSDLRSLGAEASTASSTHPPRSPAERRPGADRPEPPTVVLDVDLGVGALEVVRA